MIIFQFRDSDGALSRDIKDVSLTDKIHLPLAAFHNVLFGYENGVSLTVNNDVLLTNNNDID